MKHKKSGIALETAHMQNCLHDIGKEIYTTFQHMKGASFCIQRTCLHQSVFELPLSYLSPCCAIHFILLTPLSLLRNAASVDPLCTVCIGHNSRVCEALYCFDVLVLIIEFSLWHAFFLFPYIFCISAFSSCSNYPWDEESRCRFGTHSSASVRGCSRTASIIRVVQRGEKVSPVWSFVLLCDKMLLHHPSRCLLKVSSQTYSFFPA